MHKRRAMWGSHDGHDGLKLPRSQSEHDKILGEKGRSEGGQEGPREGSSGFPRRGI